MTTVEVTDTTPAVTDNRVGAAIIHLVGIPFHIFGALIALLIVRKRAPWLRQHARQAVNFQLNMLALTVTNVVAGMVLVPFIKSSGVPMLPMPPNQVLNILEIAYVGWAAWRTYQGAWQPYAKLIPFLKHLPEPVRAD